MSFDEYCDLLAAVAEHERSRASSRGDGAYRPAIKRLGISPARWEETLQVMSCRFARERSIMQRMFAEAGRVT